MKVRIYCMDSFHPEIDYSKNIIARMEFESKEDIEKHLKSLQEGYCEDKYDKPQITYLKDNIIACESYADFFHLAFIE